MAFFTSFVNVFKGFCFFFDRKEQRNMIKSYLQGAKSFDTCLFKTKLNKKMQNTYLWVDYGLNYVKNIKNCNNIFKMIKIILKLTLTVGVASKNRTKVNKAPPIEVKRIVLEPQARFF